MISPLISYAAPALLGLLGLGSLLAGVGAWFRGRVFKGAHRVLAGTALLFAGLATLLLGANLLTYARLSYEWPVADVGVKALDGGERRYAVTVRPLDGAGLAVTCELQGDEWMLSARVQKWKTWLTLGGADATYTFEQIANRYYTAAEANGKPITACDLRTPAPLINRYVPAPWITWAIAQMQAEDRRFGSANYMPLADGAEYIVLMTQSGLNTQPLNEIARTANDARPAPP